MHTPKRRLRTTVQVTLLLLMLLIAPTGCSSAQEAAANSSARKTQDVDLSYKRPTYSTLEEALKQRKERLIVAMKKVEGDSDKARGYLEIGKIMYEMRDAPAAIDCFSRATKTDPQLAEAYYRRAHAYKLIGLHDKVLEDFDRFLEFDPDNIDCLSAQAVYVYHQLGDSVKAMDLLNEFIEQNPTHVRSINRRGLVYLGNGENGKAMEDFESAKKIDPTFPYAPYNIGSRYKNVGGLDEAVNMFNEAIRCDPAFSDAYCQRGLIHEKQGRWLLAAKDYQTAAKAKPGYGRPYYLLGRMALKQKEYAEAISLLSKAIDIDPWHAKYDWSYKLRGKAYEVIGCRFRVGADRRMIGALAMIKRLKDRDGPDWKNVFLEKPKVSTGDGLLLAGANSCDHFLVKAMLLEGVDPDAVNPANGKTALHYVCEPGKIETARLLLNHGASPDIKDNDGKTPLDYLKEFFLTGKEAYVGDVIYSIVKSTFGVDIRENKELSVHVNAFLVVSAIRELQAAETTERKEHEETIDPKALKAMENAHIMVMTGMGHSDDGGKPRLLAAEMEEEHNRYVNNIASFTTRRNDLPIEIEINVELAIWYTELVCGKSSPLYAYVVDRGMDILSKHR